MSNIIGIIGFLGSGKNTVGNFLIGQLGYKRDSFADPLKDCVAAVFGWDRFLLEGETQESRAWRDQPDIWWEERLDWKNHPLSAISHRFTPRVALQLWGTEVIRRGFCNDIWVASLENRLRNAGKVVITDCRFPNEITAIRRMGGKLIRVRRGNEPEWWNIAEQAKADPTSHAGRQLVEMGIHISEWAWIGQTFDATIDNNGTLDELEEQTRWTLSQL